MRSTDADTGNDLFVQLAIWLAQDFPSEVISVRSGCSSTDRQKSSYGLPASSADHATGLHRKDSDSAERLTTRPDVDLCVAPVRTAGLKGSVHAAPARPDPQHPKLS
ncbi:hypothetical protein [Catenulispora acidiphila]|uniref:hypothetical protein n=1 Tax=Catenulispora acidiphila TaxID=304895 RepID=UPI00167FE024|nr:hypothetical protein [Catenulispora acidiphila]